MLLFSCVHMRNWESTIKLQPHPPRLLGHIPSQWQASFQLLSIVLTGLPNLHRGTMKKKKRKKERDRKFFGLKRTQKYQQLIYIPKKLQCQSQPRLTKFLHSLSPVFDTVIITRLENVSDFWRKMQVKPRSSKDQTFNLGSPLKTKGFPPKAMFKFATNISRIICIVRNTGVAVTRACSRASVKENPMPHVE